MNILVTGSSGFIGKHLVDFLTDKKYRVFLCDRKQNIDVMMISKYGLENVDCVVHLAAQTSVWNEDLQSVVYDNIMAFLYLYELCRRANKKFIYASSSCSVNITSIYGLSKFFEEKLVELYPIDNCVGLRFHNVYGPNSRKDTLFGKCLGNEKFTLYNNGENYRHFTFVEDICRAVEMSFELPSGLYNVFNPELISCIDFIKEVKKYRDFDFEISTEKRNRDKESQLVDLRLKNLIEFDYTPVAVGIKNCFTKKH